MRTKQQSHYETFKDLYSLNTRRMSYLDLFFLEVVPVGYSPAKNLLCRNIAGKAECFPRCLPLIFKNVK